MTPEELPPILGESAAMLALLEEASRVAPLERPVLVVGERGTGKELVAARLHFLSPRWAQPFVQVNCATLAESLLETELFGHEAGAFTGAQRARAGRFELADGGTLFLDEIASASLRAQEQILRIIEYGEFSRVGSSDVRRVDVRVIGAANVDLPSEAAAGRFRHDLLDRLAFDVLTLPPLRARGDDVAMLARHFAERFARELDRAAFSGFSEAATRTLAHHDWPGNVRELKNAVERSVHRAEPDEPIDHLLLDPFDSPFRPAPPMVAPRTRPDSPPPLSATPSPALDTGAPFDLRARVDAFTRELLGAALEAARFNQRAAADHAGLTYHQLRHELKKHDLLPATRRTSARGAAD